MELAIFIEYFIEQAHQFGMLDEKRTGKMIDRKNLLYIIQKMNGYL